MCKYCYVCGKSGNLEAHHICKRSQVPALTHCTLNIVYLCPIHHRSEKGIHGRDGHELDLKLKLEFQNKLELLFDKEYFTEEEIRETLGISDRAAKRLLKTLKRKNNMFERSDIIRSCMGGRLYGDS